MYRLNVFAGADIAMLQLVLMTIIGSPTQAAHYASIGTTVSLCFEVFFRH
jgi:hypothetical protein